MPLNETNPFAKPEIYYKYMGATGFVHTISDSRLKLSRPDDFNDPFEFSPKFDFSHHVVAKEWAEFDPTALYEANHGKLIPKDVSLEDFKGNDPNDPRQLDLLRECLEEKYSQNHSLHFQEQHSSFVRALCLTESPENNLMWSHYTENQMGLCIGLSRGTKDGAWSDPGNKGFGLRKTEYSSERAGIQVESLIRPLEMESNRDRLERIYYRKSTDWSYEKEWRIVYDATDSRIQKDSKLGMDFIPFTPDSDIVEIVIGNRIRFLLGVDLSRVLKTLCRTQDWKNPPKLFQMEMSSTKNQLIRASRPDFQSFLVMVCREFIHVTTWGQRPNREDFVKSKGEELAEFIYTQSESEIAKLFASSSES